MRTYTVYIDHIPLVGIHDQLPYFLFYLSENDKTLYHVYTTIIIYNILLKYWQWVWCYETHISLMLCTHFHRCFGKTHIFCIQNCQMLVCKHQYYLIMYQTGASHAHLAQCATQNKHQQLKKDRFLNRTHYINT